jgi:hypothetical protein
MKSSFQTNDLCLYYPLTIPSLRHSSFHNIRDGIDAYASGFLAGIIGRKEVQEAMLSGAVNSASVIEHLGAQTGLLRKEELEERI